MCLHRSPSREHVSYFSPPGVLIGRPSKTIEMQKICTPWVEQNNIRQFPVKVAPIRTVAVDSPSTVPETRPARYSEIVPPKATMAKNSPPAALCPILGHDGCLAVKEKPQNALPDAATRCRRFLSARGAGSQGASLCYARATERPRREQRST